VTWSHLNRFMPFMSIIHGARLFRYSVAKLQWLILWLWPLEQHLRSCSKAVSQIQRATVSLCGSGDNVNVNSFNLLNTPTSCLTAYYCSFLQHTHIIIRFYAYRISHTSPMPPTVQYNTIQSLLVQIGNWWWWDMWIGDNLSLINQYFWLLLFSLSLSLSLSLKRWINCLIAAIQKHKKYVQSQPDSEEGRKLCVNAFFILYMPILMFLCNIFNIKSLRILI